MKLRKQFELTRDDADTIAAYIRTTLDKYTGPVCVSLERLEEIHMKRSIVMAHLIIMSARYASRPQSGGRNQ